MDVARGVADLRGRLRGGNQKKKGEAFASNEVRTRAGQERKTGRCHWASAALMIGYRSGVIRDNPVLLLNFLTERFRFVRSEADWERRPTAGLGSLRACASSRMRGAAAVVPLLCGEAQVRACGNTRTGASPQDRNWRIPWTSMADGTRR